MAFHDHRGSVWRIHDKSDPTTFGTGFVVHVDSDSTAFLVTCAHVVDDCGNGMIVDDQEAELVGTGTRNALDMAVIGVKLRAARCRTLRITSVDIVEKTLMSAKPPLILPTPLRAVGFRESAEGFRRVPLDATFGEYEDLDNEDEVRLIQFRLSTDTMVQPKELAQGYSGSPLFCEHGVCGVVDLRERPAGHGTYKVGTAVPLWHLPKIWPGMPPEVGEQLYGKDYWPVLVALSAQSGSWTRENLLSAFRAVLADKWPEECSLWGCAFTLRQFENEDRPIEHLSRFVKALADVRKHPELTVCLPSPQDGSPENTQEIEAAKAYRRLILRIVEQRHSPRGERQRGRRYEMQVHTATCQLPEGGYCERNCGDCAPNASGRLQTIRARTLDETSESELRQVLENEISDLLGIFGCEQPDLVQIVAPERLLPFAIFDSRLDQVSALGPTRLCVLHPTFFSGQDRSDPAGSGRYLLPRIAPRNMPWSGDAVRIASADDDRDLFRQLGSSATAIVLTEDRKVAEQSLYSPVPIIVVAEHAADRVEETLRGIECLHRLPRALHAARQPLSLIYDTPHIPIVFAEGEEPVVVGN